MGRQRKFLMVDAEYRYYVQVYPPRGESKRVRLGTKDRQAADLIGQVIRPAWQRGDVDEVIRRRDRTTEALKAGGVGAWHGVRNECFELDDPEGYAEETTEIKQDRKSSDLCERVEENLSLLNEAGQHHWILFLTQRALPYLSPEHLSTLDSNISTALGKTPEPKEKGPPDSEERLSDCLTVWQARGQQRNLSSDHVGAYSKAFNEFTKVIGNLPINRLKRKHFLDWRKHVEAIRKGRGAQWYTSQMRPIGAIIKVAMKREDWAYPEGLRGWIEYEYEPYRSPKKNRQPIEPDVFTKLINKAEEWANIDVDEYAASLPLDGANEGMVRNNNKKQAKRVKRAGTMWAAILKLSANVGCDNVDVARLTLDSLRLTGELPLFLLPRGKVEHKTGEAIERRTPLLPSTVAAIKRWMEYETPKTAFIFSNDAKRQFKSEKISEGFERLRNACALAESVYFKHLRNVGATLGKRHKRHPDEREAFLGHAVDGTSRFYEGDVGDDYLVDLVNLIGAEYFDG